MLENKIVRAIVLWFIFGSIYYIIEVIWHIPMQSSANIVMFLVGGFGGIYIEIIHNFAIKYKSKMVFEIILGVIGINLIELISGCIINLKLGMNVWDYTQFKYNFMGQICLEYCIIWTISVPISIYIIEKIKNIIFKTPQQCKLIKIYIDIFLFK